jgi:DNA-binding GntR family transcriptional regulator
MSDLADSLQLGAISRVESIREQVTAALRAALISGQLRPGVLYSAPMLGDMFKVSATPVREAMLDLVREGLVEVQRNKGFRVTELSEQQLDHFAQVRLMLEVPTMGDVATIAHKPDVSARLQALRPAADGIVQMARAGDLVQFIERDTEFHTAFLSLAGNSELVRIVRDLRNRSRLYGLEAVARAGMLGRNAEEHGEMIDKALAGNRTDLEALVTRHIGHVRSLWADISEKPAD